MPSSASGRYGALGYVLLACTYLIYLPHAEYVADDWMFLDHFRAAREAGRAAQWRLFADMLRSDWVNLFRLDWIANWINYAVWLVVGASPAVMLLIVLAVHLASACLLREITARLGLGPATAFLSGALFLLLPTTHQVLFWSMTCELYVWSLFWFLLYLRSLATTLAAGVWDAPAALRQSLFLLLALFSGDVSFGLLLAGAPLTAWFLRSPLLPRTTLLAWGTILPAGGAYAVWINRLPVFGRGIGLRFDFSPLRLGRNLASVFDSYAKSTGLVPGSFYDLRPTVLTLGAAVLAVVVVRSGLARVATPLPAPLRACLWASAMWAAAYGPAWFVRTHELRYLYGPGAFLAVGLAAGLAALPRARLAVAGGLAAGLAVVSVADIEQSWIPQSRNQRAIAASLRGLGLVPGDLVVVAGTPVWLGTAPHFSFQSSSFSTPFAEQVTGVRGLRTAREIVSENGGLRAYHRDYLREWPLLEARRTTVLEAAYGRIPVRRCLLAQPAGPGAYRLVAIEGYAGPQAPAGLYRRDQLTLLADAIYFARPFSHDRPVEW